MVATTAGSLFPPYVLERGGGTCPVSAHRSRAERKAIEKAADRSRRRDRRLAHIVTARRRFSSRCLQEWKPSRKLHQGARYEGTMAQRKVQNPAPMVNGSLPLPKPAVTLNRIGLTGARRNSFRSPLCLKSRLFRRGRRAHALDVTGNNSDISLKINGFSCA